MHDMYTHTCCTRLYDTAFNFYKRKCIVYRNVDAFRRSTTAMVVMTVEQEAIVVTGFPIATHRPLDISLSSFKLTALILVVVLKQHLEVQVSSFITFWFAAEFTTG